LPPISSARSLDFFLPDDIFLHLKLHKLKQIKHNMSTDMRNMQLSNSSQKTHHVQLNNSIVTVSNDEIRLSLPGEDTYRFLEYFECYAIYIVACFQINVPNKYSQINRLNHHVHL
jgi:hypothetical protein